MSKFIIIATDESQKAALVSYLNSKSLGLTKHFKGHKGELEKDEGSLQENRMVAIHDVDAFKLALSQEDIAQLEFYQTLKRYPCFVHTPSEESTPEPVEIKTKTKPKTKKTK
jgi:hypothetical protein